MARCILGMYGVSSDVSGCCFCGQNNDSTISAVALTIPAFQHGVVAVTLDNVVLENRVGTTVVVSQG